MTQFPSSTAYHQWRRLWWRQVCPHILHPQRHNCPSAWRTGPVGKSGVEVVRLLVSHRTHLDPWNQTISTFYPHSVPNFWKNKTLGCFAAMRNKSSRWGKSSAWRPPLRESVPLVCEIYAKCFVIWCVHRNRVNLWGWRKRWERFTKIMIWKIINYIFTMEVSQRMLCDFKQTSVNRSQT